MAEKIADRYSLLSELGKGGMGSVHLATDEKFGERVALKLAAYGGNQEFLKRFEREAKIGNKLGKLQGIVRATDWGQVGDGQRVYLAMDLVEGAKPLDLKTGKLEERLSRLRDAAKVVAQVHEKGIIHRDLKPANFLQGANGTISLADFGLAKVLGDTETGTARLDPMLTQAGTAMGTPPFMPPEQFEDAGNVTPRADVYALGVMLHMALTDGALPFQGGSAMAIVQQHDRVQRGNIPMPRARDKKADVPAALDELCARALELDHTKRLETVAALVNGLDAFLTPAPTIKLAPPPPAKKTERRAPLEKATVKRPPLPAEERKVVGMKPAGGFPWGVVLALLIPALVVGAYFARNTPIVASHLGGAEPDKKTADAYLKDGESHVLKHELKEADEDFTNVLKTDRGNATALWASVGVALARGDHKLAKTRLDVLAERASKDAALEQAHKAALELYEFAGRVPGRGNALKALREELKWPLLDVLDDAIGRELPLYEPQGWKKNVTLKDLGFVPKAGFTLEKGFAAAWLKTTPEGFMVDGPSNGVPIEHGVYDVDFVLRGSRPNTDKVAELTVEELPTRLLKSIVVEARNVREGFWGIHWVSHVTVAEDKKDHALVFRIKYLRTNDLELAFLRIRSVPK